MTISVFERKNEVLLVPKLQPTHPHDVGSRRKTVELRDWQVSGNRTTGAIRLTSRLPILSLAFASRGRGTKFRTSSWHRGVPEGTPETVSNVRLAQLERNGRLMGLTCHALGSSNNSDFAGMSLLKGSSWITIDLLLP